MAKQSMIPVQNFNLGGISDSKFSGSGDSFYRLIGWDLHSEPGLLKVAQKLTKISGSTVDEFATARCACSNGSTFFGSSTSGKIWEITSGGTVRLVHTITPVAGAANILGIEEFNGYVYVATQSRLHRITVAASDDNNWAVDCVEDWATFLGTDDTYKPMFVFEKTQTLYIGDGKYVAQIGQSNTFVGDALDLATGHRIQCLGYIGNDLMIGSFLSTSVTKGFVFRWNTWSISFTTFDDVPEVGINAFIPGDNFTIISAGLYGNLYYYNGEQLEPWKKVPGVYSPSATVKVYPNAVGNLSGDMLFGLSSVTGNPTVQGVYRVARNSINYPIILDLPYPISERQAGTDETTLVLSGIQIGAIAISGTNVFVSWKNGSTYGIDKLDYTAKLENPYFETKVTIADRELVNDFKQWLVAYETLPDNTNIKMYYRINHGDYVQLTEAAVDLIRKILNAEVTISGSSLQFKVVGVSSGNTAPTIESAAIFL